MSEHLAQLSKEAAEVRRAHWKLWAHCRLDVERAIPRHNGFDCIINQPGFGEVRIPARVPMEGEK